ncbi:DUF6584 family protein [Modestobacter versicolor]|uniref:DUF6584 family protein n=1 Tax=Modestobacter versicolor TaxID=429133 RepID=UPI0034DFF748
MPVDHTLARVTADLTEGRTSRARQRLRGLVEAFPERLDLRDRLAETYRWTGDPAQAGRWAYLGGSAAPAEVTAFEALYPHPDRRLTALRWPGGEPADPVGRQRLHDLRVHSAALADGSAVWSGPEPRVVPAPTSASDVFATVGCLALVGLALVLMVLGAGVVVRALAG